MKSRPGLDDGNQKRATTQKKDVVGGKGTTTATVRGGTETTTTVRGGDVFDCLSCVDLDALVTDPRWIGARTLHDTMHGTTTVRETIARIRSTCAAHGFALGPAHTRHHWALAIFIATGARISMTIMDSAPSAPTARDWRRLAKMLNLDPPTVIAPTRQIRGSNECGLHVILHTLRMFKNGPSYAKREPRNATVTLAAWRPVLARALRRRTNLTDAALREELRRTFNQPPAGGATEDSDDDVAIIDLDPRKQSAHDPLRSGRTYLEVRELDPDVLEQATKPGRFIDTQFVSAVATRMADDMRRANVAGNIVDTQYARRFNNGDTDEGERRARDALVNMVRPTRSAILLHVANSGRADGHYVCCTWNPATSTLSVLDSLPGPFTKVTRATTATIAARLRGKVVIDRNAPRQPTGSNDCAFYALAAAWRFLTGQQFGLNRASAARWRTIPLSVPPSTTSQPAPSDPPVKQPPKPNADAERTKTHTPTAPAPAGEKPAKTRHDPYKAPEVELAEDIPHAPTTPMTHADVRRIARTWERGQHFSVSFHIGDTEEAVATWAGTIVRPFGATPGLPITAVYASEFCESCGLWHPFAPAEPHEIMDLPFPGVRYTALQRRGNLPATVEACHDSEAGSDYSSDDDEPDPQPPRKSDPSLGSTTLKQHQRNTTTNGNTKPDTTTTTQPAGPQCPIEPLHAAQSATHDSAGALGGDATRWTVFLQRPPHVHSVTWDRVTPATRRAHIRALMRLKAMPEDLWRTPLATAAIEVVLRSAQQRRWRWSTISSALSTTAAALANLPLYTTTTTPIHLKTQPAYKEALATARSRARLSAVRPEGCHPMDEEHFRAVENSVRNDHGAFALLHMAWALAARVGDARRLRPRNIEIDFSGDGETVPCRALFVEGKGASWWGPFAIHARIDRRIATLIAEIIATRRPDDHVFTMAHQRTLSRAVAALGKQGTRGFSLRSIRRGALVEFTKAGVSFENLQMLSGHRNAATLRRYLGWGMDDHAAKQAADQRDAAIRHVTGGGEPPPYGHVQRHPMPAGPRSGFCGTHGQRVRAPPSLFPKQMPSHEDLGIKDDDDEEEMSSWPLHVKDVGRLDIPAILAMSTEAETRAAVTNAREWLESAQHYGVTWSELSEAQIPTSRFTSDQIATMLNAGKLLPMVRQPAPGQFAVLRKDGSGAWAPVKVTGVKCAARGFAVPQPEKRRKRPVFEPSNNDRIDRDKLPKISYPSRRQRRQALWKLRYVILFDYQAWYDHLFLEDSVLEYFVIRVPDDCGVTLPDGTRTNVFALTREPMGSSHSAHVAQTLTWAIAEPLIVRARDRGDLVVHTMIDNVGIGTNKADVINWAAETFVSRCARANAKLNDADTFPKDGNWVPLAEKTARDFTFLGERYTADGIQNTDRNVEKIRRAVHRLQHEPSTVTRRQLAALIGALMYATHTLDISICHHHTLVRVYADEARRPAPWDAPAHITPGILDAVGALAGPVLANKPVAPIAHAAPPTEDWAGAYEAVAIIDASATGWAAHIYFVREDRAVRLRAGWHHLTPHSAHAEPRGGIETLRWLKQQGYRDIALITDHEPMVTGQRKYWNAHAGFSSAWHLNEFFAEMYDDPSATRHTFHVPGVLNPPDADSRACALHNPLSVAPLGQIALLPPSAYTTLRAPTRCWRHV